METMDGVLLGSVALFSILTWFQVQAVYSRLHALERVNAKLDLLLKNAGIETPGMGDLPAGVKEAIEGENIIEAIRLDRQATGTSLSEAKAAIDRASVGKA